MRPRSPLRFGAICAIAAIAAIMLATFADTPAQPAAADGPGTSFSIDVMPGPMGYEASPMIQDTLEVDVGQTFSVDIVADSYDGPPWFWYQVQVNYTDSILDGVGAPFSWTSPPTATTGGNLYPFGVLIDCPGFGDSALHNEDDNDANGAHRHMACGPFDFGPTYTALGDLIRFFFLCENPGVAAISFEPDVADTFLMGPLPDFTTYFDHQHGAAVTCCDDSLPDSDSDGLTECEEADLGTNPNAVDTDLDGCSDSEELGAVNYAGGLRDPLNQWDFYDVDGDKRVNAVDINKVRSKANLDYPPYDRGVGVAPWAPGAPDGIINAIDIGHVRASVNHYCVAPP